MNRVTLIGEIGVNHDGSMQKATELINAIKQTGCGIAKFQHYEPMRLLGSLSPYLAYANQCYLRKDQLEDLKLYCDSIGMEFLVSVFDVQDIPWADSLCKRHKVASRMNTNREFIQALIETGKQVLISTQVNEPIEQSPGIVEYMFCIPEYPTKLERMETLPCGPLLGLSSHCPNIAPSLRAVAQGARFIEHHITLNRNDIGCDHSSSLLPDELRQLQRFCNELNVIS